MTVRCGSFTHPQELANLDDIIQCLPEVTDVLQIPQLLFYSIEQVAKEMCSYWEVLFSYLDDIEHYWKPPLQRFPCPNHWLAQI